MISIHASWFGYDGLSMAERIRMVAQAGFAGVMLWWGEDNGPDYRKQPEYARQTGLFVENIHAPLDDSNHIWEDTAAGQAFFELLLRCVDDCAAFEIPTVVLHASKGGGSSGAGIPPMSELGLERFRRIADYAEARQVNVAVENLRSKASMERTAYVLEKIDAPRLGFCFDAGHHNARVSKEAQWDLLARFGHRLMALHLHDNDGEDDQHRLPFDGTTDWPATMAAIAATGYQGPTSIEVEANPAWYAGLAPEEFLARAYERAMKLHQLRTI